MTETDTEAVLVTGGTGYVGSYLSRALIEDGHDVVAFDASADASLLDRLGVGETVQVVHGDVTDLAAMAHTVRDHDVTRVVHLAALLSEDVEADTLGSTRVNTLGANHVLEAARLFPEQVARVVLASSETVYAAGSNYGESPVEEDALLCPDSPYSAAKRYGECLAETYREDHGVSAVALRPTGVFGPFRRSFTAFADLFENPAVGEPTRVSNGGTAVSWLHVADAADAFRRAALAPASALSHGVYNVRGEVATVAEAAGAVRNLLDDASVEVDVELEDRADLDWSAQRLSLSRSRADLGYEVEYDLSTFVREYVNAVRADAGLSPLE